ncbi:hypothetical protein AMECASPLE_035612 [Ameca splendens]|uniref:Uncharacterized protein n=1 Tax=Ameca splendens TaxID=208324 RepID=A0ABV1AEZ0_9TELE
MLVQLIRIMTNLSRIRITRRASSLAGQYKMTCRLMPLLCANTLMLTKTDIRAYLDVVTPGRITGQLLISGLSLSSDAKRLPKRHLELNLASNKWQHLSGCTS